VQGDFGRSLKWGVPAAEVVLGRIPATFALALGAMVLTVGLGLPIGIASALKPGSLLDSFGKLISLLGQSLPPFWIGIMLIMTVAVWWRLLPAAGRGGVEYYILPSIALGWYLVAAVARVTRSSMLEVLSADFVRTARSKGLGEGSVVWKHAFRNAAIPVLTLTSLQLANLLSGAVTVEIIFAWPGIGRVAVESILGRDYAVVQAVVLLTAAIFLLISLIVDLLYAYLDPRIKYA
jgi:peptide/nickel transport system permease protein